MTTPRLRMVAGPNGSGKSTLLGMLTQRSIPLGYLLNPDILERQLTETHHLDFGEWGIQGVDAPLRLFFDRHPLNRDGKAAALIESVAANILTLNQHRANGYFAAILSDFLRRRWVADRISFTFETVMSSTDKVSLLQHARASGYRTYLYFVCTTDPIINRDRVAARVKDGGHDVPLDKIEQRYHRSLANLHAAILASDRAYLFDNSADSHHLIAEYEDGKWVQAAAKLPAWFVQYALQKG